MKICLVCRAIRKAAHVLLKKFLTAIDITFEWLRRIEAHIIYLIVRLEIIRKLLRLTFCILRFVPEFTEIDFILAYPQPRSNELYEKNDEKENNGSEQDVVTFFA